MNRKVIIITGLSGSGKSTVARTLEDLGYYVVDNLPADLLPKLLELAESSDELNKLALVIDLRQRQFFPRYTAVLDSLRLKGISFEVLFVEARDEVLIRRYSETRRQHPLAPTGGVLEGIRKEREELREIKERADYILETSSLTVHELRDEIRKIFASPTSDTLKIVVESFGFGKGLPVQSDIVLDVRFLPNPFFKEELKLKDGRGFEVRSWVLSHEVTRKFLEKLEDMLIFLLPLYMSEGKQYLTISIGCTGGRHRSVVVAEYVADLLKRNDYTTVEVRHRELAA